MKRKHPLLENVTVVDAAAEGKAIARVNEKVLFIPFAAPGDIVDVQVVKKKKSFLEGKITKIHHYSDKRSEPFCSHFTVCGGCKWQHIKYEEQLFYKQKQVVDNLQRIAKIELPPITPILAAPETQYYRNKLEFTFSNKKWLTSFNKGETETIENMNGLGFHLPGMFDRVLDIDHCYLQADPSNAIRLSIRDYALQNNLSFYNTREHTGFLRNIIIRNTNKGDLMLIVVFAEDNQSEIENLLNFVHTSFPAITSLQYVVNTKFNDTITDLQPVCYKGESYIYEQFKDITYRIGPISFFQTNSTQALNLYEAAVALCELKGNELVYDLYTGIGTIANFIAKNCKHVVGIEYIESAVEDARENSKINNITNTTFFAGDMVDVLNSEFIETHGKPEVVITDPPRAGMHPDVVQRLIEIGAERIVYISCNPATQARDIELMKEHYELKAVHPVDMFPHTHHVENIVLLVKK